MGTTMTSSGGFRDSTWASALMIADKEQASATGSSSIDLDDAHGPALGAGDASRLKGARVTVALAGVQKEKLKAALAAGRGKK